ncbi:MULTISPECIES: MBL fold metallo-hydrolase [unclassified Streptomyces]|uniref:MBL fold metallo-hydrolase n=1 Tax=unclassified Streptomyces TaxID=2593676 RepID=UPI002E796921|nr:MULTISPECIES: MBL fold metallo-hydrolase [unclassified Streptomyces]MEE1758269.1 MBL fold metallo-hydrolase [Streptomyces sp. SP18BB07]MEE1832675.1 MBL fold metallo-hydrolase [Streptomyces sp. SP17KL33]
MTPAPKTAPLAPARLEEVAENVYAYVQPDGSWCLNNAGVISVDGESTLVDTTATEQRARALREAVLGVGVAPRVVVNTHSHGDHTFGNFVFPEAVVVGHAGTRAEIQKVGLHLTGLWPDVCWGEIELSPPTITYEDRLTLHIGSVRADVVDMGTAHTANDTVVWLPEQRVLFTGDLVMRGVTPFIPMGSLSGALAAVRAMRELRPEVIVPGHGPVCGTEALDETERYLQWVRGLAQEGLAAGATPLEVAHDTDFGPWAELLDPERLVPNLHRAYAELRGAAPGSPVDMTALFQEMVTFRGTPPVCHA